MANPEYMIHAYVLDGKGGGREIGASDVDAWKPEDGVLWVHMDRNSPATHDWVLASGGLDTLTAEALLAEETRPRTFTTQAGMLVILRGVNLNPGAQPEDMVGLRIWLEENRIITLRYRKVMAISDLRERIGEGRGPVGPGNFIALVSDLLVARMGPVIVDMGERIDTLEIDIDEISASNIRPELRKLRSEAILLRRHLAPQRDVIGRMPLEQMEWLSPSNKMHLREIFDRTVRLIEELDEIRERSIVLQDELVTRLSETMNAKMYLLSIIAGVFLPLGFVTGLLGVNVGGIPGADTADAFWVLCGMIAVIGALELAFFKWMKWI